MCFVFAATGPGHENWWHSQSDTPASHLPHQQAAVFKTSLCFFLPICCIWVCWPHGFLSLLVTILSQFLTETVIIFLFVCPPCLRETMVCCAGLQIKCSQMRSVCLLLSDSRKWLHNWLAKTCSEVSGAATDHDFKQFSYTVNTVQPKIQPILVQLSSSVLAVTVSGPCRLQHLCLSRSTCRTWLSRATCWNRGWLIPALKLLSSITLHLPDHQLHTDQPLYQHSIPHPHPLSITLACPQPVSCYGTPPTPISWLMGYPCTGLIYTPE